MNSKIQMPINQQRLINGVLLRCIEADGPKPCQTCELCALEFCSVTCQSMACCPEERSDKKDVYFARVFKH